MKRPIIGVLPLYDEKLESFWMVPGYMGGIEAAGGIPVMLPMTADAGVVEQLAEAFDGFLFTGGPDVNPQIYGEKMETYCGKPCNERDTLEGMLFRRVLELDKPMLGICRGLQLFNALLGGTLYQDIPTQLQPGKQIIHTMKPPYEKPVHKVSIEKDSPLNKILGFEEIAVNSYHHQGIKQLSGRLVAAAQAEDGLIEAVYMPDRSLVMAVQWHPEFMYKSDENSLRLFKGFVKACSGQ
ncbi:MAG: gamma-glutamyl-gamma-aminobutyrate hydrolase family protein [Pseudomonadota bacterium]